MCRASHQLLLAAGGQQCHSIRCKHEFFIVVVTTADKELDILMILGITVHDLACDLCSDVLLRVYLA